MSLIFSRSSLDLAYPHVMGILNVTPDSFSDGGCFEGRDQALLQVEKMLADGASIIDVGGESTRPGSKSVSLDEELARVIPVIEAVRSISDVPISIDSSKPELMRAAVAAGADMINDVNALRADGALQAAADLNVPGCLMHMQGEPRSMQHQPHYADVLQEVLSFCAQRIQACLDVGLSKQQIIVDPGFGFGKSLQHNLQLLKELDQFHSLGCPLLVGISRKSMLGAITGKPVDERLAGSVAAATIAAIHGAKILRVHDVAETVDAVKLVHATLQGGAYND